MAKKRMPQQRRHLVLVEVVTPPRVSGKQAAEMVNFLINCGLSDASDTVEMEGDNPNVQTDHADLAQSMQFIEPKTIHSSRID